MFNLTLKRILRSPIPALGVLLFAVAMAVVLQSLDQSKLEAQEYYREIYNQIDVTCMVTDLRGTKSDGLYLSNLMVGEFTEALPWAKESKLLPLIEDVKIKSRHPLSGLQADRMLVGINSLKIAPELWPENGCTIFWNGGFDTSMFETSGLVCIIPQALVKELTRGQEQGAQVEQIPIHLKLEDAYWNHFPEPGDYHGTMQVAGVYEGGDQKTVYCAWITLMEIWDEMGQCESATAISATLRNNDQVQALRQAAAAVDLAEPNPNADPSDSWLALDIDDSKLQQADLTLRNSLRVNQLSALLVFVLSAGAGFLIGFLMIRGRKKEISLMRTIGTPNGKIYLSFVTEQMLCLVLGVLFGAAAPLHQLGIFLAVYFVGLSIALLVFLRKNLLTTIKEE